MTAYAGYWLLPIPQTAFWTTHVPGWNPNPAATMLGCPRGHGHHDKDARYCSKCGAELRQVTARCTGYCAGTRSVTTLVEDLACPVHGIEAQEAAALVYPDRQAWLDSLAEAT